MNKAAHFSWTFNKRQANWIRVEKAQIMSCMLQGISNHCLTLLFSTSPAHFHYECYFIISILWNILGRRVCQRPYNWSAGPHVGQSNGYQEPILASAALERKLPLDPRNIIQVNVIFKQEISTDQAHCVKPDVMVVPYWRSSGESNCYRRCQGVPWAFHDHFVWGIDSQWSFNTSAICTLFDLQMSCYHTGWFLSDPSIKSDHRLDVYSSQGSPILNCVGSIWALP